MLALLSAVALGGYGDAAQGYPAFRERDLHLWTNAVRVEPGAFEADYAAGGCSMDDFVEQERTGTHPLMWQLGLNEAARFHSVDMRESNLLEHTSSDGTPYLERIARYYTGSGVGENIARGSTIARATVASIWMCSEGGHRENVMDPDWEDLGTANEDGWATQVFGAQGHAIRAVSMGVHYPENPTAEVGLWADFYDVQGNPPEDFIAVLSGEVHTMDLQFGDTSQGVYRAQADIDSSQCYEYYFAATVRGEEVRFPEEGSYGFGPCTYDDASSRWIASQMGIIGPDDDSDPDLKDRFRLVGCQTGALPVLGWSWLVVLGLRRRSS